MKYFGNPILAYLIGNYYIKQNGTVTGPYNEEKLKRLEEHGFTGEVK